jgi:hypothetical protein
MKILSLSLVLVALMTLLTDWVYADIDADIVIYLSFDEGSGKTAKDQSKYGNHGEIINNTEWTDGQSKKAVEISGENTDCVVVPISDSLKITDEITMMAWINSVGWTGGDQWIDKNCHNGGEKNSYGMGVFGDGGNILMMLGETASRKNLEAKPAPKENEWHHVVGTYDGNAMKIYLNGEVVAENSEKFNFQGTNDSPLRVGGSKDRPQYTFNGSIDEVIIYKRALGEGEINNVMNNGPLTVSLKEKLAITWANVKNH